MDSLAKLVKVVFLLAFHLNMQQQRNILLVQNIIRRRRAQRAFLRHMARISLLPLPPPKTRQLWMKVRDKQWWDRMVLLEYTDVEWKESFRMGRQAFMKLCAVMRGSMAPSDVTVRAPIPLTMRVAIVLFKLGGCADYGFISNRFGVHKSTVKKFVSMFCQAMVHGPLPELIRVPDEEEALEISACFEEEHHIPQIVGVMDRTHIPVMPPSDGLQDFVNAKGWTSYVLQAVVDHRCRFWSVSCESPGSSHDADVLRRSDLFQRADLLPKGLRSIAGEDVRLQIVGGSADPPLDWLLKGFPEATALTPEEESFNIHLDSLRGAAQDTFQLLKARWQVLLKRSDFHGSFAPSVIATCCALHNFCLNEGDDVSGCWLRYANDADALYPQPWSSVSVQSSGSSARTALKNYMSAHFPLCAIGTEQEELPPSSC